MFKKMRALSKVRRYMALHMPGKTVKDACGYAPYSVCGVGITPYLIVVSRGNVACPLVEFAGEHDHEPLREKYRSEVKGRGYRGYFVSVNKVERLNVAGSF